MDSSEVIHGREKVAGEATGSAQIRKSNRARRIMAEAAAQ